MKSFRIGSRGIGEGFPVFVIAEAGANWRISTSQAANKKQAFVLIDIAVKAKADAVKFQLYTAKKLYAKKAGAADYIGKKKSIYDIIKEMELPTGWLKDLKAYCDKKRIMFLCTPFDEDSVDALERVGMPAYKIASYSVGHLPFLKKIARLGKPMIMSTGASDLTDVERAVSTIRTEGNDQLALMQCTAKYPAPLSALNLRVIPTLIKKFDMPVGLSDHSREPYIGPIGAVALGAKIVEKHYTTDNSLPGPDQGFAILDHELAELVKQVRMMEESLGGEEKSIDTSERELYEFTRPGIFSTRAIPKGKKISPNDLAVLREGKTFSRDIITADLFESVIGRRTVHAVPADTGITKLQIIDTTRFIIRGVKPADSLSIWRIRNEESVRRLSNDPSIISQQNHEKWFAKYIKNSSNQCFVLEDQGDVAGYCRIDSGITSIALAHLYQGMGLGKKLLVYALEHAKPAQFPIKATIKVGNEASLKLFTGVGYKMTTQDAEAYQLEYHGSAVRH